MIKNKEHLPHRSRLKCNIITGKVVLLQNHGSVIKLTTKTNNACNVIPIVKFIGAGKIEFQKLWTIVEDGVNDNWRGKVAGLVFLPCNINLKGSIILV